MRAIQDQGRLSSILAEEWGLEKASVLYLFPMSHVNPPTIILDDATGARMGMRLIFLDGLRSRAVWVPALLSIDWVRNSMDRECDELRVNGLACQGVVEVSNGDVIRIVTLRQMVHSQQPMLSGVCETVLDPTPVEVFSSSSQPEMECPCEPNMALTLCTYVRQDEVTGERLMPLFTLKRVLQKPVPDGLQRCKALQMTHATMRSISSAGRDERVLPSLVLPQLGNNGLHSLRSNSAERQLFPVAGPGRHCVFGAPTASLRPSFHRVTTPKLLHDDSGFRNLPVRPSVGLSLSKTECAHPVGASLKPEHLRHQQQFPDLFPCRPQYQTGQCTSLRMQLNESEAGCAHPVGPGLTPEHVGLHQQTPPSSVDSSQRWILQHMSGGPGLSVLKTECAHPVGPGLLPEHLSMQQPSHSPSMNPPQQWLRQPTCHLHGNPPAVASIGSVHVFLPWPSLSRSSLVGFALQNSEPDCAAPPESVHSVDLQGHAPVSPHASLGLGRDCNVKSGAVALGVPAVCPSLPSCLGLKMEEGRPAACGPLKVLTVPGVSLSSDHPGFGLDKCVPRKIQRAILDLDKSSPQCLSVQPPSCPGLGLKSEGAPKIQCEASDDKPGSSVCPGLGSSRMSDTVDTFGAREQKSRRGVRAKNWTGAKPHSTRDCRGRVQSQGLNEMVAEVKVDELPPTQRFRYVYQNLVRPSVSLRNLSIHLRLSRLLASAEGSRSLSSPKNGRREA